MSEEKELFEWVKSSEELPDLEKFLNLKIDGHPDYGQFYELQSGIKCAALRWRLPSCDFHRIEWLKPIPQSSLTPKSIRDSDGWISVEERFPGKGERVIAFADYGGYFIAYRNVNDQWRISPEWRLNIPDGALINITHWQPLPAPPNEKSASLKPNKLSDSAEKYEPYFGWCDVEGCDNEACGGGICWRDTGYWRACYKHSADHREGKAQPPMKQSAIDREKRRGADGVLIDS